MSTRPSSVLSIVSVALLGGLAALTSTSSAVAQDGAQQPSAKVTARVGELAALAGPTVAGTSESPWVTILANSVKTSSQKDLIATVSLECGLYTSTVVKSRAARVTRRPRRRRSRCGCSSTASRPPRAR